MNTLKLKGSPAKGTHRYTKRNVRLPHLTTNSWFSQTAYNSRVEGNSDKGPLTWDENGNLVPLDSAEVIRQDIDRIAVRGAPDPVAPPKILSKEEKRRLRWLSVAEFIDAPFSRNEGGWVIIANPFYWIFLLGAFGICLYVVWPVVLGFVVIVGLLRLYIRGRYGR